MLRLSRVRADDETASATSKKPKKGSKKAKKGSEPFNYAQRLQRIEKTLASGSASLEELLQKYGGLTVAGPDFPLIAGQIYACLAWLVTDGRIQQYWQDGDPRYALPD